jgi:dihydrofolate reductase
MARLKLQMQISVDGFDPEGGDENASWDEERDYSLDLLSGADLIALGSKTAADFIPYWDKAVEDPDNSWQEVAKRISQARKIVFSSSTDHPRWNNSVIETGDLAEAINRIKRENAKDIIVYGGVSFVESLIRRNLVDEFHLFVNPVALGNGRSVFSDLDSLLRLELKKSIGFKSGRVLLHYNLPRLTVG